MIGESNPPPTFRMKASDRSAILDHCRACLPYEACGLLFGKSGETLRVMPMRNAARSTKRFALDPREQIAVMKTAREEELDLIGIYHSHPVTRPYPSKTDIENAGFWEECGFLIASFRFSEPELRCYRIIEETVTERDLEIVRT